MKCFVVLNIKCHLALAVFIMVIGINKSVINIKGRIALVLFVIVNGYNGDK